MELLAVVLGWLLADFLTGLFHWAEDRLAGDEWPVLGPLVFAPNRLHHEQPMAFTRTGFVQRNATSIAAASIVFCAVLMALWLAFGELPGFLLITLVSAAFGGAAANQVHYWAHVPHRAPRWIRKAQAIGLCQSRKHHACHHAAPQDRHYCALTDWLNPALDRSGFWHALERLVPTRWLV